jgi:two-component system, cell cycle sensor histidine kinase and response regulator CckA
MPDSIPSAEDSAAMREFLQFYLSRRTSIMDRAFAAMARIPGLTDVTRMLKAGRDESLELQIQAVEQNRWEPYLAKLRLWGESYANAGISYATWLEMLRVHGVSVREQLDAVLEENPALLPQVRAIAHGLEALTTLAHKCIGEAYLASVVGRSEARYRALFDHSPMPMWMYDRETLRFAMVNDAAVTHYGYTKDEFANLTLADIRPSEDVPVLREHLASRAVDARRVWRHRKKDGTIALVEVLASDLVMDGRDVRLILINDVTDRLRAEEALHKTEEQLRHAQKMDAIGRLAGGVAHDFNNVLTVVQSYACMLEDSLDDEDPRREDAVEIRRAAERATGITRQLLALSRNSVVELRSLDLDSLVVGFVPMLRRLVGESVKLVTHQGRVPTVMADAGRIEQVLMNLAVNARDAMPDGGRLVIETTALDVDDETADVRGVPPGRYVELAVTDTGTGMDAEMQRRIFDPFFTTKDVGKGTGLGLSIVHGIVAQAGGSVRVYSEPGHGSTFRVHLPVAEAGAAAAEAVRAVAPKALPAIRVLIVDDQQDLRAVAARVLRDAGCRVLEAATGEEARRICVSDSETIDLVLLDVVLPDARGDVLVRQLRELRPAAKVVQMSGYPAGALTPTGAAPDNLLVKPFSPSELRAAVARACGLADDAGVARAPAPGGEGNRRRALVADDDGDMRRTVVRLLNKAGFDVVDVDSGSRAITALESQPFDVVVSDVQMPDGGGLDLLRAVRRIDLDVPVILMTGEPSVEAAAAAVEYGAFRYLTKPLDNTAFVKTVEHAARAHAMARLRREAYGVSGFHAGAADRAGLEVRFDQALESLWMAFQPIVHAKTGALYGIEALLRSGETSLPNPPALIDAAIQLGRLPLIGRKARALASAALASRTDDVALFVNLHPEDLLDADLVDEAAALTKVAPRVVLEVTERASLESTPIRTERIARLRELGFRLAVDDIGAGYSGLTSFTQLTPEVVKIDMSLVRDVHKSALKQRTIGALCRLCRDVGTLVVGEGVETPDERVALVDLGCDLLQGYLVGRPSRDLP